MGTPNGWLVVIAVPDSFVEVIKVFFVTVVTKLAAKTGHNPKSPGQAVVNGEAPQADSLSLNIIASGLPRLEEIVQL